jgi:hypothetical protein
MQQSTGAWLPNSGGARMYGIWLGEVVVGVDVRFIEYSAGGARNAGSVNDDLGGQGLIEMRIHHGEGNLLAIP